MASSAMRLKLTGAVSAAFVSLASVSVAANRSYILASGDEVRVYDEPGIYSFTPPRDVMAQVLIVGGGGGGASGIGGGGGGGGFILLDDVQLSAGRAYALTVGAGGDPALNFNVAVGQPGGASAFDGVEAAGGGAGSGWYNTNSETGANGGGSAGNKATAQPGVSTEYYVGHSGSRGIASHAGGGGGAGGDGIIGTNTVDGCGGFGGAGILCEITGAPVYYACGGGGGSHNSGNNNTLGGPGGSGGVSGGQGGSGTGVVLSTPGVDGTGTGGGGGGWGASINGSKGGSGTIVIRYPHFGPEGPHIVCACDDGRFTANGEAHTIPIPSVSFPLTGYSITYSESESGPYVAERPSFAAAGAHDVWFKVEAEGLETVIGRARVLNMSVIRYETAGAFTFTPDAMLDADVLIVGGGGAGGALGGGGGGGAVVKRERIRLTHGVAYTGIVGAGGVGVKKWQVGASGGDTSFLGLVAPGGGGGGSWDPTVGGDGANGGGGSRGSAGGKAAPSVFFSGYAGGKSSGYYPGGGGGAGGVGGVGSKANGGSGNGGDGIPCDFTGSVRYYGCGGGGGSQWSWITVEADKLPAGLGGNGGANHGNGATHTTGFTAECHGDDGTGTGGGGGFSDNAGNGNIYGGNGGSGAVIIRYVEDTDATRPAFGGMPTMTLVSGGHIRFSGSVAVFGEGSDICSVRVYVSENPKVLLPYGADTPVAVEGDSFEIDTAVMESGRTYYGQMELINASGKTDRSLVMQLTTPPLVPESATTCVGNYEVTAVGNAGMTQWFRAPVTAEYELLVVGGGGAGGGGIGAGGGGGGVVFRKVVLQEGECYEVCVGRGGQLGGALSRTAENGESSSFDGIKAAGGGGGGTGYGSQYPGVSGASGGGCAESQQTGTAFGSGIPGQGSDGGGSVKGRAAAGGGGGYASAGGVATMDGTKGRSGAGGDGFLSLITGEPVYYGCGGGGGSGTTNGVYNAFVKGCLQDFKTDEVLPALGGNNGASGGNGGAFYEPGNPGLDGTGCGGGGAGGFRNAASSVLMAGGAGGSGIVVLRRKIPVHGLMIICK